MRSEVLEHKLEEGAARRRVAIWNTRRLPIRLEPGWANRLFVACSGSWCGYFPLCDEVTWNPKDGSAPYGLIFDPRRWTPIHPVPVPRFRGWRYLDPPPAPPIPSHELHLGGSVLPSRGGSNLDSA